MKNKLILALLAGWFLFAGYTLYSIRAEQADHEASIIQAFKDSSQDNK